MRNVNLLEGPILPALTRLALPIMGTSLIQMAYNLTDMLWIGRVSAEAVAAVGAAGMYLWVANGLVSIPRIGGQVKAAHALGAQNIPEAAGLARAAFHMCALLVALCTAAYIAFSGPLIAFFKLNGAQTIADARTYLVIVAVGLVFAFFSQIFTGLFTALGNSVAMFKATVVGLVFNIVLDPVLIFGVGPFPRMEVAGAALATVLAQAVVLVMFVLMAARDQRLFPHLKLFSKSRRSDWADIARIGLPVAVQNLFFSSLSMIIARLVAGWGDAAVAVQKVGSQIESITWMTADGFSTALNAFVAQNYGAGKYDRIKQGYRRAVGLIGGWGLFTTAVLMAFPAFLFGLFIPDPQLAPMGVSYLRILGVSQMFMCIEGVSAAAFQGIGRPIPSSVCCILGNAARIPMAMALSATALALDGIWWSISISSIAKGVVVTAILFWVLRRDRRFSAVRKTL